MALNAADVDKSKPGFLIHTYQIGATNTLATPGPISPGNTTLIGEQFVHQLWGWPNVASLGSFTGPGSSYVETHSINYNGGAVDSTTTPTMLNGGNAGSFLDDGTVGAMSGAPNMPGIVFNLGLLEYGIDNYALEIRTVLDLQPGYYQMGVNSDDGFRLIIGDARKPGRSRSSRANTTAVVAPTTGASRGSLCTSPRLACIRSGYSSKRAAAGTASSGSSSVIRRSMAPRRSGCRTRKAKTLINNTTDNPNAIKAYQYPIKQHGTDLREELRAGSQQLGSRGQHGPGRPGCHGDRRVSGWFHPGGHHDRDDEDQRHRRDADREQGRWDDDRHLQTRRGIRDGEHEQRGVGLHRPHGGLDVHRWIADDAYVLD